MMGKETRLKLCSYYVVRYAANLLRGEGSNIGVLLHCPEEKYLGCLFAAEYGWIRRINPRADLELLRELQEDFEQQIESHEADQPGYLKALSESLSNSIQLEGPRPCLLANPSAGIQQIYARNVGRGAASAPSSGSRLQIKQQLTSVLVAAGVWEHLEKRIRAEQWTQPGDPFTFDYGYKPNGAIHLIHALSLKRDSQLAKTLVYTVECARRREPVELTAVVERLPEAGDGVAHSTQGILLDGRVSLQPLDGVATLAQSIRRDLRLP